MTRDPLTFNFAGEIRHTTPDGTVIEADLFERGDRQWTWAARVTPADSGDEGDELGVWHPKARKRGPMIMPSEQSAKLEAVEWIRGVLAAGVKS